MSTSQTVTDPTDPTDTPAYEQGVLPTGEIRGTLTDGLHDPEGPLRRAQRLAHYDADHFGGLDMCQAELCQALWFRSGRC